MKEIKISLSTFLLIFAIIIICVMGCITYKFYKDKKIANEKVLEMNNKVVNLEEKVDNMSNNIINSEKQQTTTNSIDETNNKYTQLANNTLGKKDVLFITKAIKNNDNTYSLYGIQYKHDDENTNEAEIEDRWIMTNNSYYVTVSGSLSCEMKYDYEEKYKTVDDIFKTYREVEPEDSANPSYKHCFRFTIKDGVCTGIENVLTGEE